MPRNVGIGPFKLGTCSTLYCTLTTHEGISKRHSKRACILRQTEEEMALQHKLQGADTVHQANDYHEATTCIPTQTCARSSSPLPVDISKSGSQAK